MAEASSNALFTGDQGLDLLDSDTEDFDDGMDDVFFPGSDNELGFVEEEIKNAGRLVKIIRARTIIINTTFADVLAMMREVQVEMNMAKTAALGMG